ncbi:MAG: secretin N-terminal domain-containing protein [Verrucomicrobiota bacterium]
MKTINLRYRPAMPVAMLRRIILAAILFGTVLPLTAQVRIMSQHFPPGFVPPGGGMPAPAPDNGGAGPKNSSGGPWIPSEPLNSTNSSGTNANDGIQLSFQGASVDMVAQWLSQTTGKTVIKHPQVQCQLTIMSVKKVPVRQAINMIYRALAMQGCSAVELADSILLVPQGQEPKMSPEVVTGSTTNLPAGRQLLVKVFTLNHIQAADAKDRIQTALSDKGSVDVDERANEIIVTDFNDNLRVVGDLIDALDNDHSEDVAVRIIPLKHIAADELAKEMAPIYEKMGGKAGNKSTVDVAADDRSNSLIILSSLADFGGIEKLVSSLDTENAQEETTKTFILQNADAQDVAKQLQDLSDNQNSSGSRYTYYFSPPPESNGKKLSVVADRRRNAIVVQAPPAQMDSLEEMIKELDAPVSDDSLAPEIVPLKYVSATDIEDVLNELFLKKTQQRNYWDFFDEDSDNTTEDHDVGRLYGKVRITSEPYSNAIIITSNSKENLAVIENVLKQLDQPSQAGESTLRIGLKYAKADTVADSLNILFAKNGSPALHSVAQPNQNNNQQAQPPQSTQNGSMDDTSFNLTQEAKGDNYYPWIGGQPDATSSSGGKSSSGTVSDLVGRVRCVSDQRGNALLISANVHFFPQILQLIQNVDAPSDKVTIEARIVQVSSDYLDKLGVRWSPNGSTVFSGEDYDDSLLASAAGNYQQGFGGTTLANNPGSSSVGTVIQTLASLRSGMISSTLNIDYLVQFLRENTDATVLGEPSITIDDNEMGKLFVGQEVPVPENTQVSSVGSQNTSITYKDVGVTLEVTPHINSDGDVQLKIHAESSTVDSSGTVLGGDVFDTDNFRTEATAKSDQTLLLGGIIQKQYSNVVRKFPVLGDVPGLGWAFKKKDKTMQEVELMVFLRPVVIQTAKDSEELQEEFKKETPLLQKWQSEQNSKSNDN